MAPWLELEREGVRLACRDFGGRGAPVLLLHGLAGYAEEWSETASWLTATHRVLALDQRGHGRSERKPADVSRAAFVADVALVVERLGLGPVVLVGQSLGSHTAMLVAARHRSLVRALIVAEGMPSEPAGPEVAQAVRDALAAWPVPFATRDDAVRHFDGPSLLADAWADGLERRSDGLWPRFDVDVMGAALRDAHVRSSWPDWEAIRCPTLLVRAEHGIVPPELARAMIDRLPHATVVEIAGARHDVHLDRPREWRDAVTAFLAEVDAAEPSSVVR